ncbi:MAG: ribonuclease HII [Treponema sp.]|nr:ribonuclease HII [Treponema sp.]
MDSDVRLLAGLDEAGRGPLAGPVSAGCVILPPGFPVEILSDSKRLSEKKRLAAEKIIKESACWAVALVDHEEIDRINILRASLKAMSIAYNEMLEKLPAWCAGLGIEYGGESVIQAIADGNQVPDITCAVRAEVKADGTYPCVMAASILAKTERDRIMLEFDRLYPQYGYAWHKGYPTPLHKKICRELGPSPIQRLTFKY